MNHKPERDDDPLFALICELDDRLERGGPQELASSVAESLDGLTSQQREEFQEAGQALLLLHRMRRNIGALQELDDDLSDDAANFGADRQPLQSEPMHLPKSLGRFEILDVLGQGGFSRVFLARDPQLDRLIALKVPRPRAIADGASRRRFEREAMAAATLSHPAIVPIFETGTVGPINYIAYGYCDGRNLAEWMSANSGNRDPRDAARIVAKLSEAVAHAHQRGIVHRDLKPANVLVESADDFGVAPSAVADRLRITDFGLAKLDANANDSLTLEGAIVGTPAYMSPEQARGETTVGARSDVFALGAILYELLTGKRPFQEETHLATLRAIEQTAPKRPKERNPNVPRDLEAVCLKCLEKRPEDRYQSAHDLEADLGRFLDGRPVMARMAGPWEKTIAWVRREPWIAASLSVAFMALAIGLAFSVWQLRVAQRQGRRAERNLGRAQTVVEEMVSDVATQLRHVPELKELRSSLVEQAVRLQEEMLAEEQRQPSVILKTAQAYRWQADYLGEFGDLAAAIAVCDRGTKLLDTIPEEYEARAVAALHHELRITKARLLIRADKTGPEVEASLAGEPNGEAAKFDYVQRMQLVERQYQKGNLKLRDGDYVDALSEYQKGLEATEELPQTDKRVAELVIVLNHWSGQCQIQLSDTDSARAAAAAALPVIELQMQQQPDHPVWLTHLSSNHTLEARCHERDEDQEAAAVEFSKAREIAIRLVQLFPKKIDHVRNYIYTSTCLSTCLKYTNEDAASEVMTELIDFLKTVDANHLKNADVRLSIAKTHSNLADLHHFDEEYQSAIEHHRKSKEIYEDLIASIDTSDRRIGLAWCLEAFADSLIATQQWAEAREICNAAIGNYLASGQVAISASEQGNVFDVFGQLVEISLAERNYPACRSDIRRMTELLPERKLDAATLWAACAQAVTQDQECSEQARQEQYLEFLRNSAGLIRESSDGEVDLESLREIESFATLVDDPEFLNLVRN